MVVISFSFSFPFHKKVYKFPIRGKCCRKLKTSTFFFWFSTFNTTFFLNFLQRLYIYISFISLQTWTVCALLAYTVHARNQATPLDRQCLQTPSPRVYTFTLFRKKETGLGRHRTCILHVSTLREQCVERSKRAHVRARQAWPRAAPSAFAPASFRLAAFSSSRFKRSCPGCRGEHARSVGYKGARMPPGHPVVSNIFFLCFRQTTAEGIGWRKQRGKSLLITKKFDLILLLNAIVTLELIIVE